MHLLCDGRLALYERGHPLPVVASQVGPERPLGGCGADVDRLVINGEQAFGQLPAEAAKRGPRDVPAPDPPPPVAAPKSARPDPAPVPGIALRGSRPPPCRVPRSQSAYPAPPSAGLSAPVAHARSTLARWCPPSPPAPATTRSTAAAASRMPRSSRRVRSASRHSTAPRACAVTRIPSSRSATPESS